jgi:hypothetical protein
MEMHMLQMSMLRVDSKEVARNKCDAIGCIFSTIQETIY